MSESLSKTALRPSQHQAIRTGEGETVAATTQNVVKIIPQKEGQRFAFQWKSVKSACSLAPSLLSKITSTRARKIQSTSGQAIFIGNQFSSILITANSFRYVSVLIFICFFFLFPLAARLQFLLFRRSSCVVNQIRTEVVVSPVA